MKELTVNGRYRVNAPDWQLDWDGWTQWEKTRFASMEANLTHDDVLFDIGSEDGVISAIYAQFVRPENMCLLEPAPENWPNIREIWNMNDYPDPLACFMGFAGEKTQLLGDMQSGWPEVSAEPLERRKVYRYLFEENHVEQTDTITLDDWSSYLGVIPTAITMDVEGAELLVLTGMKRLLEEHRPKVWVSVHPDLMQKNFHQDHHEVGGFMQKHGYDGRVLGVDHETHVFYTPR